VQPVAAIEAVFRAERARVLATTIRVTNGDFDLAEEAVQDAFTAALAAWETAVPEEPRAWLVQVARNKAIDTIRRRIKLREIVAAEDPGETSVSHDLVAVHDDRLRLIFTCFHPALAPEAQIALTLRTLGGLTTEEIARAFLTSPATMAQRLVRAKTKIRDARIPYEVPEASQLAERTDAVMAVIYLVFNEGYAATAGDEWVKRDLCHEAIRLGRLLVELTALERAELAAPHAEAQGLLALMLLHDSRRDARTDAGGDLVLLEDQDRATWDRAQIDEALALVPPALRGGPGPYGQRTGPGSYALQAAIAALHAAAARAADTDWPQIAGLFGELSRRYPSPVVALNHAVAIAMWRGPEAALPLLDELKGELADYHLWHAARADMLRRLGRTKEAATAYRAALARVGSEPERRFLERRLAEVQGAAPPTGNP
jgi:RNA polymerase sigma-70 factor (ECF subfamily)